MKTVLCSFALPLLMVASVSAADVTGKWSGTYDVAMSDGDRMKGRVLLVLTQNGSVLAGTIGPDEQQQTQITKGKVEGDRITFETQTEGPLMRFEQRLEDYHILGEGTGDVQGTKIRAKIELARQD